MLKAELTDPKILLLMFLLTLKFLRHPLHLVIWVRIIIYSNNYLYYLNLAPNSAEPRRAQLCRPRQGTGSCDAPRTLWLMSRKSMASRGVVWMTQQGSKTRHRSGVWTNAHALRLARLPEAVGFQGDEWREDKCDKCVVCARFRSRSEAVSKNQWAEPDAGWRPAEPKQPNRTWRQEWRVARRLERTIRCTYMRLVSQIEHYLRATSSISLHIYPPYDSSLYFSVGHLLEQLTRLFS